MVLCEYCGNNSLIKISSITITEGYLKSMKDNLPSYKYGSDHPDWANIARIGNFIVEFQCKKCHNITAEICY
jgi:hypothetical protein